VLEIEEDTLVIDELDELELLLVELVEVGYG
jgi:hypothetical protein